MISERAKSEVKGFVPYLNALSVIIIVMMGIRVIGLEV
jgi:hypothetical protein